MKNLFTIFKNSLDYIKSQTNFNAKTALILGSGLGDFSKSVNVIKTIKTEDIPSYPVSTVQGHSGRIHFAEYKGNNLLLFEGRIHLYEGYRLSECLLPIIISKHLNTENIIITNAAGGINKYFKPGDLMLINSFSTLFLKKELSTIFEMPEEKDLNSLRSYPNKEIYSKVINSALEEKINLKEGSYFYNKGPCYETPAEIKMIAYLGFDAVGMSTVHELVLALKFGMNPIAISCITNYAAGISNQKLSHSEVTETADRVKSDFERLIKRIIFNL